MAGIDHAHFANDACGAPIPPDYLMPHVFFDGKIFLSKIQLLSPSQGKWGPQISSFSGSDLVSMTLKICGGNVSAMVITSKIKLCNFPL